MITRSLARTMALQAGVASSLMYLTADVLGGLAYDGYSFWSQAVSELMATGAPSEHVVDPLFITYDVLVVLFAAGLMRDAARHERALRITARLLEAYGLIGLTGPILFEMQPRGLGHPNADVPHIVVTALLLLLQMGAIISALFAFGRGFRMYSIATIVVVIVMGGVAARYGPALAAGAPTPGFGFTERVCIYTTMLWIAVLSVAAQRRSPGDTQPFATPVHA